MEIAVPLSQAVGAPYQPLYKYLDETHAQILVLTFEEVEALIGFPLPSLALTLPEWWADASADGAPSPQSRSWNDAHMTAKAHLSTKTVVFERACADPVPV